MKKFVCYFLAVFALILMAQQAIAAQVSDDLKIYGDFRLRFESDTDSAKSNGSSRDDRARIRARARVGLTFTPRDDIEIGLRIRSGTDDSHQSPQITLVDLDDNDTGDADFNLDKWYFKYKNGGSALTAGRSGIAFWKQNEMLFDDDVTPVGVGYALKGDTFGLNLGYYTLPVGMQEASGNLGTAQLTFKTDIGSAKFAGAIGVAQFDPEENDADAAMLLDGNGSRDYDIWTVSGQLKFNKLKFGIDYYENNEDYSATDPDAFTALNHDQDTGYVFSAAHGGTSPQSWLFAYYYLDIETFAVNSSYAQDDWVRFGSAVEARASNIEGHELRIGYGLAKNMNLILRAYFVEANELRSLGSVDEEDGDRIRLDFNYKF